MGSSTDQVGSVDTTGIAPGPHADVKGVSPIFDKERERLGYDEARDLSDDERWEEKAVAAGTEDEQEKGTPVEEQPVSTVSPPQVRSMDTTGLDTEASSDAVADPGDNPQAQRNVPSGIEAILPETAEETRGEFGDGGPYDEEEEREAYKKVHTSKVLRLANSRDDVDLPEGADKAAAVDALVAAKVRASEAEDAEEPSES